jgi:hypothetical protein
MVFNDFLMFFALLLAAVGAVVLILSLYKRAKGKDYMTDLVISAVFLAVGIFGLIPLEMARLDPFVTKKAFVQGLDKDFAGFVVYYKAEDESGRLYCAQDEFFSLNVGDIIKVKKNAYYGPSLVSNFSSSEKK